MGGLAWGGDTGARPWSHLHVALKHLERERAPVARGGERDEYVRLEGVCHRVVVALPQEDDVAL